MQTEQTFGKTSLTTQKKNVILTKHFFFTETQQSVKKKFMMQNYMKLKT